MRVLVTGAQGFIGKNLVTHLNEDNNYSVIAFARDDSIEELPNLVEQSDAIVHLAGENRPADVSDFDTVNAGLTEILCDAIQATERKILLIFASSIQADLDNPYGKSKRKAELAIEKLTEKLENSTYIYRLPGVFGKWCKPNYNSVVATFCHNIANGKPIKVNNESTNLRLVYVDDVISDFIKILKNNKNGVSWPDIKPEYFISLGELADQIMAFGNCRNSLVMEKVGAGLARALYSTYVSYLPTQQFTYKLPCYGDERGEFVEMLKTKDSGQFSYFTAHPGVTRGGHYHHSKTEKFLVIKGHARFGFRNIQNNEAYEVFTKANEPQVVETIPGWTHDITNVGDDEMIVMIWANEIFNPEQPDTIICKV